MKPFLESSAAVLCALALSAAAQAECSYSQSWTVDFTGGDTPDVVTVDTLGDDCGGAVVALVIRAADGRVAYADIWPHVWFSDNTGTLGPAESNIARISPSLFGMTSGLAPVGELMESDSEWLETSPEDYEQARQANAPVLCYNNGHESGRCIWYDAAIGGGAPLTGNGR